ncbi:Uncharacterized protein APZ42_008443 [Daphnia magna]|uniref:Uncharacterized protein n=1 Tax=Daphnia magna TaxID=35525 RepID=A0A164EMR6_9CRUS|nr:Uncharacterized protein APZ42_008443 [Daphnia magna]
MVRLLKNAFQLIFNRVGMHLRPSRLRVVSLSAT